MKDVRALEKRHQFTYTLMLTAVLAEVVQTSSKFISGLLEYKQ